MTSRTQQHPKMRIIRFFKKKFSIFIGWKIYAIGALVANYGGDTESRCGIAAIAVSSRSSRIRPRFVPTAAQPIFTKTLMSSIPGSAQHYGLILLWAGLKMLATSGISTLLQ